MPTDRHYALIASLTWQNRSPGDAVRELVNDRVYEALPAILGLIFTHCSLGIVPDDMIEAFLEFASINCIPELIERLEDLHEGTLENDEGDKIDEYCRIQEACLRIMVGLGDAAVPQLRAAYEQTTNSFARDVLSTALKQLAE